ncbi:MAG: hypothetical protein U0T83_05640 [Bacteriovoracaceae bacterium]
MKNIYLTLILSSIISAITLNLLASNNNLPNQKEFLELKKEVILLNLKNINSINYIPQDVIYIKNEGNKIIPRNNPLNKVYMPGNPKSDKYGFIMLPNINKQKELDQLTKIEQELRNL